MERERETMYNSAMMKVRKAIWAAILAALLYSLSSPFSKVLLSSFPPALLAGFLYLGAGIGTAPIALKKGRSEARLGRKDIPYTVAMVLLDIAAPISMMYGLRSTPSESASLLGNFEIVATAAIAFLFFKEHISLKTLLGIILTCVSSIILTLDFSSSLLFSRGSLLIILATILWGLENNCTRRLSEKDPLEIVAIKGLGSGIGGIILGLSIGEKLPSFSFIIASLILGFFSYGLSISLYIFSQRWLGAARTSAYYALSPFMGVIIAFLIFKERSATTFWIALPLMVLGTIVITLDTLSSKGPENPSCTRP